MTHPYTNAAQNPITFLELDDLADPGANRDGQANFGWGFSPLNMALVRVGSGAYAPVQPDHHTAPTWRYPCLVDPRVTDSNLLERARLHN